MNDLHTWYIVAVIAFVTAAIRYMPFIIFNGKRKTPEFVNKLGKLLPYAIMGMLVVYCLKDVSLVSAANYLPTLIACLVVGVLYVWKRNTLISIIAGTICHMLLVQMIF